ncbi:ThiF family adenylyltransferase [Bacillus sp. NP157]|nr:ThiF family adenylyltransferase [Bacillus sp. NP157]
MKPWFTRNLKRVADERAALACIEGEGWWATDGWTGAHGRLTAEGTIFAGGRAVEVRLVYPELYPLVPCWVEPRDGKTRLSRHQFGGGGSLCLEVGPDNWSPAATGADMLRSAHRLLEGEAAGVEGDVPDGHHEGAVQAFTNGNLRVLLGQGCLARIGAGVSVALTGYRYAHQDNCVPLYLCDDADRLAGREPPPGVADGIPVVVFDLDDPSAGVDTRADLAAHVDIAAVADEALGLFAVARIPGGVRVFHLAFAASETVFECSPVVLSDDAGMRSGRAAGVTGKTVVIVGAGSVGSKVAESVVRAGVRIVGLVDGDVMLPPNIERHALDWRDIGYRKVDALARRLGVIAPSVKVIRRVLNLDWQQSAKNHAATIDLVASADVVVDATGDMGASLLLGAVASSAGRPFVSVQVFEGGLGCLVARSVPGKDATFADGRASFNAWCGQQATPPPPPGHRAYEGINAEGEPVVADDAAVTIAAGLCARVALDILDGAMGGGQPAWLLVGFRQGWVFSGLGSSVLLDVGPATEAPDIDAMAAADPVTANFVLSLFADPDDAAAA